MKRGRSLILLACVCLIACSRDDKGPDQWDAFVYPDIDNMDRHEEYKGFKTFELCQQAAVDRIRLLTDPQNADYECGYRCKPRPDMGGLTICKETRK